MNKFEIKHNISMYIGENNPFITCDTILFPISCFYFYISNDELDFKTAFVISTSKKEQYVDITNLNDDKLLWKSGLVKKLMRSKMEVIL